jgi:uncharacterized protein related to proFAR isomerase
VASRRDPDYDLLLLLDRLEELREEMLDIGVRSIDDIEARIEEIESQVVDDPDGKDDGPV